MRLFEDTAPIHSLKNNGTKKTDKNKLMKDEYQVLVIGGGINGTGVAREAAARGYKTLLVEKNDYAHATSTQSSKMIHGGIRYLENGHFALVRESLKERRILLKTAPHLVHPMRINIPVYKGDSRAAWKIQLGCKLYDIFAGKQNLAPSRKLNAKDLEQLSGLQKEQLNAVLRYSDGQVLDSRLTLETALSAASYGADVRNYVEFINVTTKDGKYHVTLLDKRTGKQSQVTTKFLINMAGPWVPQVDTLITNRPKRPQLKFVRGIHFVIPSIGNDTGFLILPADGRVVFVLPWLKDYTLVGTTESVYEGKDFDKVPSSKEEREYLLEVFNHYFPEKAITQADVKYTYSGVRPLIDMGEDSLSKMSREYRMEKEMLAEDAGYLAVFGGKITTYRSLACKVLKEVSTHLAPENSNTVNTEEAPLFGGFELDSVKEQEYRAKLVKHCLPENILGRWKEYYGSQWTKIADYFIAENEFRQPIVFDYFLRAELQYMVDFEQAYELEDVILRRTKLIYEADEAQRGILQEELTAALHRSGQ